MFREKQRALSHYLTGLLLGSTLAGPVLAQDPVTPPVPNQAGSPAPQGRPSRAHMALNQALETQRRGDYEAAVPLIQEANRRKADLTPAEQAELALLVKENADAVKAHRIGSEALKLAEKLIADSKAFEAHEQLRLVAVNEQYLSLTERRRFMELYESTKKPVPAAETPATPLEARERLKQARALLVKYDVDGAEKLAQQVDKMKFTYAHGEDTPKDVLEAVAKARTDPKLLLTAARAALTRGDLNQAEELANKANKVSSSWSFNLWSSDSPSKVLKDVQAARTKTASKTPATQTPGTVVKKDPVSATKPETITRPETLLAKSTDGTSGKSPVPGTPSTKPGPIDPVNAVIPAVVTPMTPPGAVVPVSATVPPVTTPVAPVNTPVTPFPDVKNTVVPGGTPLPVPSAKVDQTGTPDKTKAVATQPAKKPADETEIARKLLIQARTAMQQGNYAEARQFNEQARMRKANLAYWEDNPERVAADLAKLEKANGIKTVDVRTEKTTSTEKQTDKDQPENVRKERAVALLKQGRTQIAENKFDEAMQTLLTVKALNVTNWGLFEYTPDKLRQEMEKARTRHDQEESVKVLTEARKAFQEKDYETAKTLAYKAQKLHGVYPVYDFGDRPSKLLGEIETARAKDPKGGKKESALAQNPKGTSGGKEPSTPSPETMDKARLLLRDARLALQNSNPTKARRLAEEVQSMHVVLNRPGEDTPEAVLRDVDRLVSGKPVTPPATEPGKPSTPLNSNSPGSGQTVMNKPDVTLTSAVVPVNPPTGSQGTFAKGSPKEQAQQLVAEARSLQKAGRILEAGRVAASALQLKAPFGPEEDSPELLYQHLAAQARQQIDLLTRQAHEAVGYGKGSLELRFENAERNLATARQLALVYGQDFHGVDEHFKWLASERARASGAQPPGTAVAENSPKTPTPINQAGQKLIEDARRDLTAGDTISARKKAIEACQDQYGISTIAVALIREIDAEEDKQRVLQARRGFDAAVAAYQRKDYPYAMSILNVVDLRLLDADRRDRLKNIINTPEMSANRQAISQGLAMSKETNPAGSEQGVQPIGVAKTPLQPDNVLTQTSAPTGTESNSGNPARAVATDQKQSLLETSVAMRTIKFQQLRADAQKVQSAATEKFRTGQADEALKMLDEFLESLDSVQLDPAQVNLVRRSVQSRREQFGLLKEQKEFAAEQAMARGKKQQNPMQQKFVAEDARNQKVAKLMKDFNQYYREGKYNEAIVAATKAHELDGDNPVAAAAIMIATRQRNISEYDKIKEDKKEFWREGMNAAETAPNPALAKDDIHIDADKYNSRVKNRKAVSFNGGHKTTAEREIENKLSTVTNLNFTDTPLRQAIEDLRAWSEINIYVDEKALASEGVSLDHRVTLKLEKISMRSGLTLLLKGSGLTFMTKDDVLQITTEKEAHGKMVVGTYLVADLVMPVDNFGSMHTRRPEIGEVTNRPVYGMPSPAPGPVDIVPGTPVGSPTSTSFASQSTNGQPQVTKSFATNTQEKVLIDLITHTIAPDKWADSGGSGVIEYNPQLLSLVISQTPDIQDQVQELLTALRRLQDQEVAVEVKVVSLSDDFYEIIGVNFSMNIPTNTRGTAAQVANGYRPSTLVSGITPAGNLTSDLSIPITNNTFSQAFLPFYGGNPAIPGVGGISMGLAFLSDIQVFLFLEAAQSDRRTNVMQAPKLTLFNGQTANLLVSEQQPYVTNVLLQQINGQVIFQPQVQSLGTQVQITIQAVISADRRFVRLSLNPFFNVPVPGPIQLFPIVVPVFPVSGIPGQSPAPILFTQMIQQPAFNSINVGTTVAVPDGGTVVLGGMKAMAEARTEVGPPVLSKIPYINRLFRNVAYGRESSSLLIMVTPRIIILEEEEVYQTGYNPANPQGF